MAKTLIASALIAAQLLPWASGALYMCVASDGSVGVDGGPAFCNHCDSHTVADKRSCCQAPCCDEHDGAAHCDDATVRAAGACDCQHVLISQAQAIMPTRQSAAVVDDASLAGIVALPATTIGKLADGVKNALQLGDSHERPAHDALNVTILRC